MNKLPDNFCSVAWLQIHSEPDGDVSPCCYYDLQKPMGNWGKQELINIYNSLNKPTKCVRVSKVQIYINYCLIFFNLFSQFRCTKIIGI